LGRRIAASKKLPDARAPALAAAEKRCMLLAVSVVVRALTLASLLAVCACSSSSNAPVQGSLYDSCTNVDASATCSTNAGFDNTIAPILAKSCMKNCHDGSPDAAWPLTDYDDVQAWTTFISQDLLRCTMPPVNAGPDYPITREDRETILNWIVCGAPQ
jgi:hypothetical protein